MDRKKDREIARLKEELERVKRVERLTTKVWDAMQKVHSHVEKSHNIELNTGGDDFEEIIEKLGQYEDLEEQGLLLREEDVLKFYYCESEDKYLVGQRTDTRYYAEVGKTGLCFRWSRFLPWGEHVVAPHTVWKEHTYPSEPKEIPFFDWLQGYIKQLNSKSEAEKALEEMEK